MNKQELINRYSEKLLTQSNSLSQAVQESRNAIFRNVIADLELLNENQKVKVPPFVAEWIEQTKKKRRSLYETMDDIESSAYYHKGNNDTYQWLFEGALHGEHQELFAEAYMHGYEVEEEPKYYLLIPYYGYMTGEKDQPFVDRKEDASLSTEFEIKAVDERLWAFAVPVEKV